MNLKILQKAWLKPIAATVFITILSAVMMSSSHREAPLIANDQLADNTDLYAFRSPDNPNKITIIACYVPMQLPQGGPNYYSFGENIRYDVHIDNNIATPGDDIVYRFAFKKTNQDPSTFFNIRLGQQNLKTTYTMERSTDGGRNFYKVVTNGIVPPPNIGPRSISNPTVGLGVADYNTLINNSIATATSGEKVFCGTADDPFFVDLGGAFDVGDAPRTTGSSPVDGLKCLNVSVIALQIDISTLQKDHKPVSMAANILDKDYVIGVWASSGRKQQRTLHRVGNSVNGVITASQQNLFTEGGEWIQCSRLGMPLTNEVVIPIGYKDIWNSITPYEDLKYLNTFKSYFYRPELALYMDNALFGGAVPALAPLRIQKNSLGSFGFGNTQDGLYPLKGTSAVVGTALDDAIFGTLLLPGPNSPRSVDLYPIFHTGVPNLSPYQLAVMKGGNPLAAGKPFINNFLPNGGDMLRLNMATPVTPRTDPNFSSLGLLKAAALGLTTAPYNTNKNIQSIPNMDGFPNGRRLEDDVTRIELQAVSGIVLSVLGLWYDDFVPGGSPLTPQLLNVLNYSTGINANDVAFKTTFPYVQRPWSGSEGSTCSCSTTGDRAANPQSVSAITKGNGLNESRTGNNNGSLSLSSPDFFLTSSPNPVADINTLKYHVTVPSRVTIAVYDNEGRQLKTIVDKKQEPGTYTQEWSSARLVKGSYFISASIDGMVKQTVTLTK